MLTTGNGEYGMEGDYGKHRVAEDLRGFLPVGAVLPDAVWEEAADAGELELVLTESLKLWAAELKLTGFGDTDCFLRIVSERNKGASALLEGYPIIYPSGRDKPHKWREDFSDSATIDCDSAETPAGEMKVARWPVFLESGATAAFLGMTLPEEQEDRHELSRVIVFFSTCFKLAYANMRNKRLTEEIAAEKQTANKKDAIFLSVQKMITLIDVKLILNEVIHHFRDYFPDAELNLLLSQDIRDGGLPVKPLNIFDANNELCTRA